MSDQVTNEEYKYQDILKKGIWTRAAAIGEHVMQSAEHCMKKWRATQ